MYKKSKHTCAFRFRRFCREGWAAYSSMHREVTIGRLAARVADCSLAKGAATAALALALSHSTSLMAQDDGRETRTLPEMQVTVSADSLFGAPEPAAVLSAQQLQQSSVRTVGDILAMLPGVDVRTRGVGDVQADLSMRGSTFDQMVVMLNGINFTDPQTGHFNLDLPIDIAMVQRVELLTPSQLMGRGIAAFCGAVNIVVDEAYAERLMADIGYGSHGTVNASMLATRAAGPWAVTAAASYHRSDGYMPNTDYRHGSLFLQAARHADADDWQLQLGGQAKGFGGAGFYSTTYPDQYEATRTLVASAFNVHRFSPTLRLESAVYGRLHRDRFELFRDGYAEAPSWYTGHNHHLGSSVGLRSRMVQRVGKGELLAGAELRRDGIRSNVLGLPDSSLESPFSKSASRLCASLFGGYGIGFGPLRTEGGAMVQYNSMFGCDYGLSGSAVYSFSCLSVRLAASRTFRTPTFTDLYYQSRNQVANPDLRPEASTNIELGLSGRMGNMAFSLALYRRAGSDIIDWVRSADEEVWYSMNHTRVDAMGADLSATYRLDPFTFRLAYAFCHIDKHSGALLSQYALEYLRHKGEAAISVDVTSHLRLKAEVHYRLRDGYYADGDGVAVPYGDVWLVNASAEYLWRHATLYVGGYNLGDALYRDHGGVPMPGRTAVAGLRLSY